MPSESTRNTLARQWELLKQLPGRGTGKSARELAQALSDAGYKVSKRQVERDLVDLSTTFPIIADERSKPYGWRWEKDVSIDLPGITLSEALSLHLIEETLKPLIPASMMRVIGPRLRLAEKNLKSLPKHQRYGRWPDKVRSLSPTLPFIPPRISADVLETVQLALLEDRQLSAQYQPMESEVPKEYVLHPLALVQCGPVTYLVATAYAYEEPRIFALHRMVSAEFLNEPVKRPKDFDLDQYIRTGGFQFGNGKEIRLKARVGLDLARILTETPLSNDQKISERDKDSRCTLTATIADSWQLRWWVLSQGSAIEVVGPTKLRAGIAKELKEAANIYR